MLWHKPVTSKSMPIPACPMSFPTCSGVFPPRKYQEMPILLPLLSSKMLHGNLSLFLDVEMWKGDWVGINISEKKRKERWKRLYFDRAREKDQNTEEASCTMFWSIFMHHFFHDTKFYHFPWYKVYTLDEVWVTILQSVGYFQWRIFHSYFWEKSRE
jgi:hypothetical protein